MTQLEDIAAMARKAIEEAIRELGQVNVLIAGRTGVGKSTLINAIFQGNLAATGQGRPVTQTTREITKEGIPFSYLGHPRVGNGRLQGHYRGP